MYIPGYIMEHRSVGQRDEGTSSTELRWTRRHLVSLEELSADELRFVLDTADSFKEVSTRSVKKVPALRGRVVVNAFFEDSTRTRMSFSLAAQRLSAKSRTAGLRARICGRCKSWARK